MGTGDPSAVRAAVPPEYQLETDPTGRPLVLMNAVKCDAVSTDGGRTSRPTIFTVILPEIVSPDGQGCESQQPAVGSVKGDALPICNFYGSEWYTDNPELARWADQGFPGGGPASFVSHGLVWDQEEADPTGTAQFRFESPDLTWRADVRQLVTPALSLHIGVYWDSPDRSQRVKIILDPQDDANQGQVDGSVTAKPGSVAEKLFGGSKFEAPAGPDLVGLAPRWDSVVSRQVTDISPAHGTAQTSAWCRFDIRGTANAEGLSPVGVSVPGQGPVHPLLVQPQRQRYVLQGPVHCTGSIDGRDLGANGSDGTMTAEGKDPADPIGGPNDTYNSCTATHAPFDVHLDLGDKEPELVGTVDMQTAVFDMALTGQLGDAKLLGRAGFGADPDGTEGQCMPNAPYQQWAVSGEMALSDLRASRDGSASGIAPPIAGQQSVPMPQGATVAIAAFHYVGAGTLINGPDAPPPNLSATTPSLVVTRGEPITFVNLDSHPHTVTSCSQRDCDSGQVAVSTPVTGTAVGRPTNYCLQAGCADGRIDSQSSLDHPGGTFVVDTSALAPGTYNFFCEFHRWMRGSFTVVG